MRGFIELTEYENKKVTVNIDSICKIIPFEDKKFNTVLYLSTQTAPLVRSIETYDEVKMLIDKFQHDDRK